MLAPADSAQHVLQAGQEGGCSEERRQALIHAALLDSAQQAAHKGEACSSQRQALQEQEAPTTSSGQVSFVRRQLPAFGPSLSCLGWLACKKRASVKSLCHSICSLHIT